MSLTTSTISVNAPKGTQALPPIKRTESFQGRTVTSGFPKPRIMSLLEVVRKNPPGTPPSLAAKNVTVVPQEEIQTSEVDEIPQQSKLNSVEDFTSSNESISIGEKQFFEQTAQFIEEQFPKTPEKEKKRTLGKRTLSLSSLSQLLKRNSSITPPPSPVTTSKRGAVREDNIIPVWTPEEVANHLENQGSITDIARELNWGLQMAKDLNEKIAILNNLHQALEKKKEIPVKGLPIIRNASLSTAEKIFSQNLKVVISDIQNSKDPSAALQAFDSAVIAKLMASHSQREIAQYYPSFKGRFCEILACCSPKKRSSISLTNEILEDLSNCPDVTFAIQILMERKLEETIGLMVEFCRSREKDMPDGVLHLGILYMAQHPLKSIASHLERFPTQIAFGVLSLQADPSSIAQIEPMVPQKLLALFLTHKVLRDDDNKVFPEYLKCFSTAMQWHTLALLDRADGLKGPCERILMGGLVYKLQKHDHTTFSNGLKDFSTETQNDFFKLFDDANTDDLAFYVEGKPYASAILNVKIRQVKKQVGFK